MAEKNPLGPGYRTQEPGAYMFMLQLIFYLR